jgi:hypothetical protein
MEIAAKGYFELKCSETGEWHSICSDSGGENEGRFQEWRDENGAT